MSRNNILRIDLRGYWHAGGGRGGGAVVDAVVHRDSSGLPVVPGKHLKGLLRDAVERAEAWEWMDYAGLSEALFGTRTEATEQGIVPKPGCLRVGDGRLPVAVSDWLGSRAGDKSRPGLFRNLYASAVDHNSGTALDKSLRGMEVTVPLQLEAQISVLPGMRLPENWVEKIQRILPLIDAVGAYRTRGLGRAVLTLEVEK